jgi:rhamnosyltransferase subunit B
MHVLISCIGSAGDVFPFMAIGQALRNRGHRVDLLSSPYFRNHVESAGLGFIPLGTLEDYEQAVADADLWHPRRSFALIWRSIERNLRNAYQQIADRTETGTVLVGSTLAFNSRLAQEKLGLPGATVHLSPSCIFSARAPAKWPSLGWLAYLPPWLNQALLNAIERNFLDPVLLPGLNAFRSELGLSATRHVMSHWLNSPDQVICAFPDWFAAPQSDWPQHSVTIDFPRQAASAEKNLEPALVDFLQAGPPSIGITPGSAMAHGRPVFERALAACDALGLRAVVITPYRDQLPARLENSVMHVNYAPFELLLPKLAAFIHHGGIGTSAQCLAAGLPQLVSPWAYDQFDNAARLCKLGVALRIAPLASKNAWIRAMRTLTHDANMTGACRNLALKIRDGIPAAERIAEQIEKLHTGSIRTSFDVA